MNYPPLVMPERLKAARIEFGAFLRAWRTSNGWSIRTFEDWAKEAPKQFRFVLRNSSWSKIENGEGKTPSVETFIALGELNQAIAAQRFQMVTSRRLRDVLVGSEPVREANGRVWEAGDFFDAFVGEIQLPKTFDQAERTLALASTTA